MCIADEAVVGECQQVADIFATAVAKIEHRLVG
jgi:hypothetical protein